MRKEKHDNESDESCQEDTRANTTSCLANRRGAHWATGRLFKAFLLIVYTVDVTIIFQLK
jgi:hypothetical protein